MWRYGITYTVEVLFGVIKWTFYLYYGELVEKDKNFDLAIVIENKK